MPLQINEIFSFYKILLSTSHSSEYIIKVYNSDYLSNHKLHCINLFQEIESYFSNFNAAAHQLPPPALYRFSKLNLMLELLFRRSIG